MGDIFIEKTPLHFDVGLSAGCRVFHLRKEGNVFFNDALNTFYLRLYGVGHMVKDHSDSERGNPLPPHGLLLYAPSHRQDSTYHGLCYTSLGGVPFKC